MTFTHLPIKSPMIWTNLTRILDSIPPLVEYVCFLNTISYDILLMRWPKFTINPRDDLCQTCHFEHLPLSTIKQYLQQQDFHRTLTNRIAFLAPLVESISSSARKHGLKGSATTIFYITSSASARQVQGRSSPQVLADLSDEAGLNKEQGIEASFEVVSA
jgi:hypothetical protein